MKHSVKYGLLAVLALSFYATVALAGPTTGVPPFQSFGGGPDIINLGNLNVHYSFPVFSRAGRGIPFSYALAYDSSVWAPAGSVWAPSGGMWGLTRDVAAAVGTASVRLQQSQCVDPYSGQHYYYNIYWFSGYRDSAGTGHGFPQVGVNDNDGTCGATPKPTATILINDGSGITLNVSDDPSASATLKSGEVFTVPVSVSGSPSGPSSQTDSNGNQITSSTTSGVTTFYDTLSSTTRVLTISGTAPNPVSHTYTAPSGGSAAVVISYVSYNVQTNFGCAGINEYGPISDSLVDRITLPDGSYYQFSYEPTPGVSGKVTGRVASVRLPTGGTISYSFQGLANDGIICTDGSTAGFTRTTPDGAWTYSRATSPLNESTITDPQGNQAVVSFQTVGSNFFETQRQIYQGTATGTPLEAVTTCYNGNTTNCTTTALTTPFSQITKFTQLNGGSQARMDTLLNGYGLTTEKDEYDFGIGTATRKTTITYAALGNNIVDHPASVVVTDGSGNLKSKTTYAYDGSAVTTTSGTPNHVSVTGARGNLTTLTTYSTSTATLTRTFKYYDTGTVYQSQDVNGQWTTYTYGACGNSFLTNVSMPLSLSKSANWNCTGGVMTSSTDENGKTSYVNYTTDPYFWRAESAKDPLLNITTFSYPSLTQTERSLNFNGTTSTVDAVTTLDSLGRVQYTQQKQAQGSSTYDSVRQTYDSLGRPYTVSVPYAGAKASPPSGGAVTTTYYDALGRPKQAVDGGGGTTNITYNQNDVYSEAAPAPSVPPAPSAENTKRKQLQYDALGRLRSVCEVTSEATYSGSCGQTVPLTGYLTNYAYDVSPNFNSLTVTQNAQRGTSQTRRYIYDMLGRLTSETNPETSNLAYTYVYDSDSTCGTSQGDLVKRVDAKGNVTCYAYDVLHRVLSVTYPSGPNSASTAKKYFAYDAATVNGQVMANPKGRLAEAYTCTTCPGTKITDLGFGYSARGEITDVYESTPHSGAYYHLTASYWAHGALNALSGVSGLPTIYYGASDGSGLDGEGRVTKVTASSGQNPVTGVTYTTSGTTQPIGSLTQVTLGSGDNDTFGYDINTGRLTQYKFNIGATPQTVQGDLTWNANATLAKLVIADPFNSVDAQTCTFGYDDLARIKTANCGSVWNQTFTLDPFGNLSKSGTITFQPGFDQTKNWFLPVTGFDNNGNLLSDSTHAYGWDAENKLTVVDTVSLTFDALGRMVEQARGSSYTQIVYAPTGGKLALMTGQSLQKAFVSLPGGGTALYSSAGLAYYRHADWLGSSRFASTPSRTKYFDVAYAPYGEDYADSGTVDLSFTGQNQDTVSGLYDFSFREYHANSGRWIQPDPAGLAASDPSNPQTWNRYAYVSNNPLSHTDPMGLFEDAIGCFVSCGGGGVFAAPNFFTSQLDASNRNSDFGFDRWVDWNNRQTFGDKYYDLPGHSNPVQQALGQYIAQVNQAFAQANAKAAAEANERTAACIATGLQSTFSGSSVTAGGSTGEVGGHWNFAVQLQFSSFDTAGAFTSVYAASAATGWPPPARFGSGAGPALHLENLGGWSVGSGTYAIGGTAHIDLFNPNNGAGGLAGHIFVDGLWGHVVQFFGGNIDPKVCPYK